MLHTVQQAGDARREERVGDAGQTRREELDKHVLVAGIAETWANWRSWPFQALTCFRFQQARNMLNAARERREATLRAMDRLDFPVQADGAQLLAELFYVFSQAAAAKTR